jgi:pimeloyl-ACP methyl ester carboxylesterase
MLEAAARFDTDSCWTLRGWIGGGAAVGPAPIGSFEALDAMLAMLADRKRFPALTRVVVAGHSGGGQVVQRYAVVGEGPAALAAVGVDVRYVVANPSSYLYFDASRRQLRTRRIVCWIRPLEIRLGRRAELRPAVDRGRVRASLRSA